jgi:hypothetical protein
MVAGMPAFDGLVGGGVADGARASDGDVVAAPALAAPALAEACEAFLVDACAADGAGDAVGPLHPAANTHKSSTAQTANVTARFCINVIPRKVTSHFRYVETSAKVHKVSVKSSFPLTPSS